MPPALRGAFFMDRSFSGTDWMKPQLGSTKNRSRDAYPRLRFYTMERLLSADKEKPHSKECGF